MIDSCSYTPIKSHACMHSNNLNDIGNSCMLHPAMCIVTEADLRGIKRLEGSLENGIYMHACTRLAKSGLLSRAIRDKELIINIYKYYKIFACYCFDETEGKLLQCCEHDQEPRVIHTEAKFIQFGIANKRYLPIKQHAVSAIILIMP